MELRTQYLLLLFVFGIIAKGMVKVRQGEDEEEEECFGATSALGSNLSILLLVCVGIYYWRTKQKEKCIYDDIARQQAEAAAKLDALHGVGDGKVTELSMAMRKTSFKLNEADTSVITAALQGPHPSVLEQAGRVEERPPEVPAEERQVKDGEHDRHQRPGAGGGSRGHEGHADN
ncbi:hypothetical protein ON010_g11964 [Phytophthora cinnamomi]|nr:hypothetical protein ON010_g11964 [Phytophthora cinnamomi]